MITAVSILDNWSLSKRRFQRHTFTGNELFALFICFDITKFVSLSVFTPIEMISPKICAKLQQWSWSRSPQRNAPYVSNEANKAWQRLATSKDVLRRKNVPRTSRLRQRIDLLMYTLLNYRCIMETIRTIKKFMGVENVRAVWFFFFLFREHIPCMDCFPLHECIVFVLSPRTCIYFLYPPPPRAQPP